MKKFLMIATVPSMIGQFNMNNIQILKDMGYEVHVACNFDDKSIWTEERINLFKKQLLQLDVKRIQIDFARTPYDIPKLIKSYRKLHRIMKKQQYERLHCHTPVAGVVARFAAFGMKTKVIYTVHGFHFYKGAPLKNWIIYYPIEKVCSYLTDILITINHEDYILAQQKMKAKKITYIPGIGIDIKKFGMYPIDEIKRNEFREKFGCKSDEIMLLSVGELSERKNHQIVIKALAKLKSSGVVKFKYYIVGQGILKETLEKLIQSLELTNSVKLLGFRSDIKELLSVSDLFVFPSLHEGLPVALMEAMASGLPVACSKIRGNIDLIKNEECLFDANDVEDVKEQIKSFVINFDKRKLFGDINKKNIAAFDEHIISNSMKKIYQM